MERHLYDEFAKRWALTGSVWFYSDPHFGDEEMKRIRKNYITDEEQVRRINSKVGRKDTLIILGDVGDVEFVKKLRGHKVLIMGNHDGGASNYLRHITQVSRCPKCGSTNLRDLSYDEGFRLFQTECQDCHYRGATFGPDFDGYDDDHLFDEVYEGALMISPKIILSHEPLPNLPTWLFNIHGHDHSNWFTGSRHLNVCAEHIDYTPVSLNSIVKDGLLKDVEDIHRVTIDNAIERKAHRH